MIKLIATDLDGTLLNTGKKVPGGFVSAVRKLYRHGIRFAIASGREKASILRLFPDLEEFLLIISNNGAMNYDGNKIIGDNSLTVEEIRPVFEAVSALPDVDPLISCEHGGYYSVDCRGGIDDELLRLSTTREIMQKLFPKVKDPLHSASLDTIAKLAFYHRVNAWDASQNALAPFMERFQIFPSEPVWVNLMKKGIDKGSGIRQLQQYLGVTPAQTMAFGDYLNDCSMFREAGVTCAMKNGHPDLKAMASCIAPSNDDDGVMRVLRNTFVFLAED